MSVYSDDIYIKKGYDNDSYPKSSDDNSDKVSTIVSTHRYSSDGTDGDTTVRFALSDIEARKKKSMSTLNRSTNFLHTIRSDQYTDKVPEGLSSIREVDSKIIEKKLPPEDTGGLAPRQSTESLESDDINIRVSVTKLEDVKISRPFKQKIYNLLGCYKKMTQEQFEDMADKLNKCTLKSIRDPHELHIRRAMGMRMVSEIVRCCPAKYITFPHVIHITWAIMSCMHHYQLRLISDRLGIIFLVRKRQYERCLMAFGKFIRRLSQELRRVVLNAILIFYKEGKLWIVEFECSEMIVIIMENYKKPEELIEDVIYTVQDSTCYDIYEAKQITLVLSEILKILKWSRISTSLMSRLLHIYINSVQQQDGNKYDCKPLKNGLEICLMNLIGNLKKKYLILMFELQMKKLAKMGAHQEKIIIHLGNLAMYTVRKFRSKTKRPFGPRGLLPHVIQLLQTEIPIVVMLCAKIWQQLLDTFGIADKTLTPRIYFPGRDYSIPNIKCHRTDKLYFRTHRQFFYRITLLAVINATNRHLLEEFHKATVLTQIQVPCGYAASCIIAIGMAIQEHAFRIMKDELVKSHHMHAFVMSIFTLTCVVYKAEVLWQYVSSVMQLRAQWSPHLNPPLMPRYKYALHHILWNKPELFFDDWEVRFGLWKCFRTKRELHRKEDISVRTGSLHRLSRRFSFSSRRSRNAKLFFKE